MSKDDDSVSNPSTNTHFSEVLEVSMRRRRLLQGGLGATALAFFGGSAVTAVGEAIAKTAPAPAVPTCPPRAAAFVDDGRVPPGYTAQVLYSWGDPTGLRSNMPEFHAVNGVSANTAGEQAFQAGIFCFAGFFGEQHEEGRAILASRGHDRVLVKSPPHHFGRFHARHFGYGMQARPQLVEQWF